MRIRETLLAQIWEHQLFEKDSLLTIASEEVRVIYSGRKNSDRDPDYCDAIIAIGGGIPLKGDVEIHIRSYEWRSHGHHRDPYYNGVILHVVMWSNGDETSLLHSGNRVPILALYSYLLGKLEKIQQVVQISLSSHEPCQGALQRYGIEALVGLLNKAGEERFYLKVEKFKKRLDDEEAGQVIYEGIMRALGYAKNMDSFEELARMLPLNVLGEFAQKGDNYTLQALMLGTAGLLPKQRDRRHSCGYYSSCVEQLGLAKLERIWESYCTEGGIAKLHWRFFRVRPENFPTRRILGASYLLSRYGGNGKLANILNLMKQGSLREVQKDLELGLVVKAEGDTANHSDFGLQNSYNQSLIGLGRAREIIVNILLPFSIAWAEEVDQPWLRELAMELYRVYPRLGENQVTRYMKRQIFGGRPTKLINSACREQGLIYLYESFCVEHRCTECPLV